MPGQEPMSRAIMVTICVGLSARGSIYYSLLLPSTKAIAIASRDVHVTGQEEHQVFLERTYRKALVVPFLVHQVFTCDVVSNTLVHNPWCLTTVRDI